MSVLSRRLVRPWLDERRLVAPAKDVRLQRLQEARWISDTIHATDRISILNQTDTQTMPHAENPSPDSLRDPKHDELSTKSFHEMRRGFIKRGLATALLGPAMVSLVRGAEHPTVSNARRNTPHAPSVQDVLGLREVLGPTCRQVLYKS